MILKFSTGEYHTPEWGRIVPKAVPFVSLRCNPVDKDGKPMYVDIQLGPAVAKIVREYLSEQISAGYAENDFVGGGELTWKPEFGFKTETFEIALKVHTRVESLPIGFEGGKLINREVLTLVCTGKTVLHIEKGGRVFKQTRQRTLEFGTASEFVTRATEAQKEQIDFRLDSLFVWKREGEKSKMINEALSAITAWTTPPKAWVI